MSKSLYLQKRHTLESGDLLVCEHKDWLWRYVGHTAGIYKNGAGQLMVLESTFKGMTELNGVQLHPMGDWLAAYPGKVHVRRLLKDGRRLGAKDMGYLNAALEAFIAIYRGSSYPDIKTFDGRLKLYLARLDIGFNKDWLKYGGDDNGIFCTMLWAMFYVLNHIMRQLCSPQEYEPRDTEMSGGFDRAMAGAGWSLENMDQLK